MAPTYKTAEYWRSQYPAVALILADHKGSKVFVKTNDPLPEGRWRLLGIIGVGY